MKKLFLLLKASMTGNMNIFKYKTKKHNSILIPLLLTACVFYSVYFYAEALGNPLKEANLTYILLTLFSLVVVVILFLQGIYKGQGLLFEGKDNNLLFSLPIKKNLILTSRVMKILAFEYMFEALFLLPAYLKYALITPTTPYFYIISILFFIVLPIIPTILSCIISYFVRFISSKTKFKKITQIIISFIMIFVLFYISFNMNGFMENIVSNATSLNEVISKIYLPIGLYIDLIGKFNLWKFMELILITIIPFAIFIYVLSIKYSSIINENKEVFVKKKVLKNTNVKSHSIENSLLKKEANQYFSSPLYIFNTGFGLVLIVILTICLCINFNKVVNFFATSEINLTASQMLGFLPLLFMAFILYICATVQISASSISLEGKKLPLLKSLPVSEKQIFDAKIKFSNLVMIPILLICSIVIIIRFNIFNINAFYIIALSLIFPSLISTLGLLVNLKYPKLEFNSEVEVIKQSVATLVSMFSAIILATLPIIAYVIFEGKISINLLSGLAIAGYLILLLVCYKILNNYGVKKFKEL